MHSVLTNMLNHYHHHHHLHRPPVAVLVISSICSVALLVTINAARTIMQWRRLDYAVRASGVVAVPLSKNSMFGSLLGLIPDMKKNMHRMFDWRIDWFRSLKATTIYFPTPVWAVNPWLATADPAIVKHILGKDTYDNYIKHGVTIEAFRGLIGDFSIFILNHGPNADDRGEKWARFRKTAARIFTRENFRVSVHDVFSEHADTMVRVMENEFQGGKSAVTLDMQRLMFRYTLDAIGRIGFGININTLEAKGVVPFAKAFDEGQVYIVHRFFKPGWNIPILHYLYESERIHERNCKIVNSFATDVVKRRRVEQSRFGAADILSLFMNSEETFSDVELKDVVLSFLIAGRDTTACTLTFALMLLAHHQDIQDRLRAEVRANITIKKEGAAAAAPLLLRVASYNELAEGKTPLLKGTVMESVRMFPPVPSDSKYAVHDDVLPNGMKIPAGTRISYEPFVMGRLDKKDPGFENVGWDQPNVFDPLRWAQIKEPSPFVFTPFQAGPRICMGMEMAKYEAQLVLAVLVSRYRFSPAFPGQKIEYVLGTTLTAKDGTLKVERVQE